MKVAVEGCCHGDLDAIYESLEKLERERGFQVDLLICCGDFQCTRNAADLQFLCCPVKYRALKDFPLYYEGKKKAKCLTLFIGGNHEAINVLGALYYGGWVAPNIFYLGHAGVVRVGGLRIAALSGIFKPHDYRRGYFEGSMQYNTNTLRSAYHVREFEIKKLAQLTGQLDVMVTHDWPESIYEYGDKNSLLQKKPHFSDDVKKHALGNPHTMPLLKQLKPSFWFAAHLHVFFPAVYVHPNSGGRATRFLALDKVLPNRRFLQVLDLQPTTTCPAGYASLSNAGQKLPATAAPTASAPPVISFDLEWLAILRANQLHIPTSTYPTSCSVLPPKKEDFDVVRFNLEKLKIHKREVHSNCSCCCSTSLNILQQQQQPTAVSAVSNICRAGASGDSASSPAESNFAVVDAGTADTKPGSKTSKTSGKKLNETILERAATETAPQTAEALAATPSPTASAAAVVAPTFESALVTAGETEDVLHEKWNVSSSCNEAENVAAEAAAAAAEGETGKPLTGGAWRNEGCSNCCDYDWPPWDSKEVPFSQLDKQRQFFLRILGYEKEEEDVLFRNLKKKGGSSGQQEQRQPQHQQAAVAFTPKSLDILNQAPTDFVASLAAVATAADGFTEELNISCSLASSEEDEKEDQNEKHV